MAAKSGEKARKEPVSNLIDDLVREFMKDPSRTLDNAGYGRDSLGAALREAAIASLAGPMSRASTFERLLISQAIASTLADSLAPALARALAPEIMKAFGHLFDIDQRHNPSTSAGGSRETA